VASGLIGDMASNQAEGNVELVGGQETEHLGGDALGG
jgi:hypothetical protein